MACQVTSGRSLACKSAFGGIKAAYFFDLDALGTPLEYTAGKITGLGSGATPTFYKYDLKGSSSLETTITSSRDNGTTFYTQTLSMTLTYLDNATQQEVQLIAAGRPSVAVEDYYGNMFVCGLENGMELTGGSIVTGTAAGDLSGFTLSLEGMEETAAPFITSTLVTAGTQGSQINPTA